MGVFFYLITLTGLIGETKHVSNTLQTFFPSSKLKKMPVKKTAGAKMHPNGLEELHSQSKHIHALKTIYNKILGKGLQMWRREESHLEVQKIWPSSPALQIFRGHVRSHVWVFPSLSGSMNKGSHDWIWIGFLCQVWMLSCWKTHFC